ncbi:MAG: helix-turn-helix domain-containing protein [Prevotella sp.]|nr:helix-turn-helix domain-containing protein [Prevotella sp.]
MKLPKLYSVFQKHAAIVLFILFLSSFLTGFHSFSATKERVVTDMDCALTKAMLEQEEDVITPDTIRLFNQFLKTEKLRGKATLVVRTQLPNKGSQAVSSPISAHCSSATIFALSDQRPSLLLLTLAMLWGIFCRAIIVRQRSGRQLLQTELAKNCFGGMSFYNGKFYTFATGEPVKLTPMQHQLMEMFFQSPTHSLSKFEICDTLWPKKMDANETLYTLIRRLRPVVERHSDLHIESDRSRAYRLVARK